MAEQVGPQREEFVRICMNYVSQALQDINNPANGLVIERCLTILRVFYYHFLIVNLLIIIIYRLSLMNLNSRLELEHKNMEQSQGAHQ